MKNLIFLLVLSPFLFPGGTNLSSITKAISSGNANALGDFFDQTVEISVLDEEDVYNKEKAIQVVTDFFGKCQPKSFSEMHRGTSKGKDSQYCIGNLTTNAGTFRVYIYLKTVGEKHLIQELRFDEE